MTYQMQTNKDSPNYTPGSQSPAVFGRARVIQGITIHWWGDPAQNPSFEGVRDYLCRPNGNTSAHYVATGTGRRVACIVAPGDVAWHSGNAVGNATTIGIEVDPRGRDEDYDVAAELVADIRSAYGDVPIYAHNMWSSTSCPGRISIERIDQLSYQKVSHANWGDVTDLNPKTPTPVVVPILASEEQIKQAYREILEREADAGGIKTYSKHTIEFTRADLLRSNEYASLVAKKAAAAALPPTTKDPVTHEPLPDTGVPVTDKNDFTEADRNVLQQILTAIRALGDFIASIFKSK